MLASELIDTLRSLVAEHGNMEVVDENDAQIDGVEFNEDGDPAIVVIFD